MTVAATLGVLGVSALAEQQSIYQRPASITATISGSPKLRDGSFTGQGTAGICGEISKFSSLSGEDTFSIEFSGADPAGSVYNISLGSKQLVRGVQSGSKFILNVSVVTADGGRPPVYALDTQTPPKPGLSVSGNATLISKGRATTLSLTGTNEAKETITLKVTCG